MTKFDGMTKSEDQKAHCKAIADVWDFGLRISFVIRHLAFAI